MFPKYLKNILTEQFGKLLNKRNDKIPFFSSKLSRNNFSSLTFTIIKQFPVCFKHRESFQNASFQKVGLIQNWQVRSESPSTYFLPPAKIVWDDPACHMTPSRHHLWFSSESTSSDKWVLSDEQLMEWLAKVTEHGEAPFLSLISIRTTASLCKCLITSGQRSA